MILIPIPNYGFDPTEVSVPWSFLKQENEIIVFATPEGCIASGDERLLTGRGFGPFKKMLMADKKVLEIYQRMIKSEEFLNPIKYSEIREEAFDAILLPGGHDPGMKQYLENDVLQEIVSRFFERQKPVGAICHGVVLAARSIDKKTGASVLYPYNTTALLKTQEMGAYFLTCLWLKNYYRTYPMTVQKEVTLSLKHKKQFHSGKLSFKRDTCDHTKNAFVVKDSNFISARWPGDAHLFVQMFYQMLIDWRIK